MTRVPHNLFYSVKKKCRMNENTELIYIYTYTVFYVLKIFIKIKLTYCNYTYVHYNNITGILEKKKHDTMFDRLR